MTRLVLLLVTTILLYSFKHEEKSYEFKHLTVSDGLSHNGVSSIIEDSNGFMWFGTYDGLNRYDGENFTIYRNTNAKEMLVSNRIRCMVEDNSKTIWIGTENGVMKYDLRNEKFTKVFKPETNNLIIIDISINSSNTKVYAVSESQGIYIFNKDGTLHKQIKYEPTNGQEFKHVQNAILHNDSTYILGSNCGMYTINTETGDMVNNLYNKKCFHIVKADEKNIIIATANDILHAEISSDNTISLVDKIDYPNRFRHAYKGADKSIGFSNLEGELIHIADWHELFKNPKIIEDSKTQYLEEEVNTISCYYHSSHSNGRLWYGTFKNGIMSLPTKKNPFHLIDSKNFISQRAERKLWILGKDITENKAFIRYGYDKLGLINPLTKEVTKPSFNTNENLGNIVALFEDSKARIWIRKKTNKNICLQIKGSNEVKELNLNIGLIISLCVDNWGHYWFKTSNGVFRIVIDEKGDVTSIEPLYNHKKINKSTITRKARIYADPEKDVIWVGSYTKGLFKITLEKDKPLDQCKIENYRHDKNNPNSIPSNFVSSIIRLGNGELWIGTERGGICKGIQKENSDMSFTTYSEKDGLSNNVVKAFLSDRNRNLWIATNYGLNLFNTNTKTFQIYTREDGLPFDNFLHHSTSFKNGQLMFGGVNKVLYFMPEEVNQVETLPKFRFGDFKLLNTIINTGDTVQNRVLLEKNINDIENIELKYNENFFSIDVLSLHFSNSSNYRIRYRIPNYMKEWVLLDHNQNNISVNGLAPGKYSIEVAVSNSINQWSESKTLHFNISRPLWKTTIAIIVYIFLIIIVILLLSLIFKRLHTLKRSLILEHVERDNDKKLNTSKLQFFSNISHEIKTPLTLIYGPIEDLIAKYDSIPEINETLSLVQRQSKKILMLVNQIHDFQKADANILELKTTTFLWHPFISDLVRDFEYLALNEDKEFKLTGLNREIKVQADKDKIEKIINNILSNAFKYSSKKAKIHLSYTINKQNITIQISDTGRGIHEEEIPYIFNLFYQSKLENNTYIGGAGVGLSFAKKLVDMHNGEIEVESELKKGSVFTITLPIVVGKSHYRDVNQRLIIKETTSIEETDQIEYIREDIVETKDKITIFLVEDDSDLRNYVANYLSNYFQIECFSNGKECLEQLDKQWPDLILSDIMMPEINGIELCKEVKENINTCHIPIVLVTASTESQLQLDGRSFGADAYITKPYKKDILISTIKGIVESRKKITNRFQMELPLNNEKKNQSINNNKFMMELYLLMEKHFDNPELDIDYFPKMLCMSRTHFYKQIKEITGQTPYDILKNYRLKKAAKMLVDESKNVTEVFHCSGFKSRSHFYRAFTSRYDISPSQYAKTRRTEKEGV